MLCRDILRYDVQYEHFKRCVNGLQHVKINYLPIACIYIYIGKIVRQILFLLSD